MNEDMGRASKIGLIDFKHIIDDNLKKYVLHPNLSFSRKLDQYYKNNKYALFSTNSHAYTFLKPTFTAFIPWKLEDTVDSAVSRHYFPLNFTKEQHDDNTPETKFSMANNSAMISQASNRFTLSDIPANKALYML